MPKNEHRIDLIAEIAGEFLDMPDRPTQHSAEIAAASKAMLAHNHEEVRRIWRTLDQSTASVVEAKRVAAVHN